MPTNPPEGPEYQFSNSREQPYDAVDNDLRIALLGITGDARKQLRSLYFWHREYHRPPLTPYCVQYINARWYGVGVIPSYDLRSKAIEAIANGDWSLETSRTALKRNPVRPSAWDEVEYVAPMMPREYPVRERAVEPIPVARPGHTVATRPKGSVRARIKPTERKDRPSQQYDGRRHRRLMQRVREGFFKTFEEADKATPRRWHHPKVTK